VDLTYCELRRGDALLLCSDGLSGMVRFEDIREALRTTPEPIDACKLLTERANQAGGHDNITVIVAQFDGEGLKALAPEGEPLKYKKYVLPEEKPENTERTKRPSSEGSSPAPVEPSHGPGSNRPQGLASTMVVGQAVLPPIAQPSAKAGEPNATRPPALPEEEQIEIPGTHVPPWVVVVLVIGVMLVLLGTAFLFLR
jgi:protein phosphatase